MRQIIVEDDEKIRIDAYIAKKQEDLSRSNIQKLIQEGNVLVKFRAIKDSSELESMRKEAEDIVRNSAQIRQHRR